MAGINGKSVEYQNSMAGVAFVGFSIHEVIELSRIRNFNLHYPAFAIRIFIDKIRGFLYFFIELKYFASNRHINICNGFYCLDCAKSFLAVESFSDGFYFNKYDIAQFGLCKIADAYKSGFAFNANPFMTFGVE
ncbi:hypothetical protein SDC9_61620 [bioreactor metagenome]|uniref:Uncharacterized protein n=1 Tax=bioreactor metagenome TaxID=1076179 RepID=A0A644XGA1_9ZZZZ